jgi:branched-chain amino acid transport system substrate-binding protein
MKSKRRFAMWTVILVLLLAACSGTATAPAQPAATEPPAEPTTVEEKAAPEPTAEEAAAEPSGEPIKIGGTLGLTGAFAGPSAGYKVAYDYWLERVNAEGGLLGRPVEMIIYDDESTPATAQTLYQRLINEDQVDLLLAPYTTLIGGAILPIAESNEMVLWNGGFVGIDLFRNSDWIVGAYTYQEPDYPRGIFELIDSLPEDQRPTRVGIATSQNPFTLVVREGYEGYGGVLNFAQERGMEVVMDEQYDPAMSDASGLIQRAKSANVDLFFALSLPNDAALLARTAQELDFNPQIYCACGSQVTTVPYWKDLGPAGEGIMSTAMAWPTDGYSDIEALYQHFKDELGYEELPAYGTVSYSILQVLEQAVKGAGTLDQATLRDYVTNRTFDTVNGPMAYDENRIPAYNAIVVQFVDGHNEVVWPPERATADPIMPVP